MFECLTWFTLLPRRPTAERAAQRHDKTRPEAIPVIPVPNPKSPNTYYEFVARLPAERQRSSVHPLHAARVLQGTQRGAKRKTWPSHVCAFSLSTCLSIYASFLNLSPPSPSFHTLFENFTPIPYPRPRKIPAIKCCSFTSGVVGFGAIATFLLELEPLPLPLPLPPSQMPLGFAGWFFVPFFPAFPGSDPSSDPPPYILLNKPEANRQGKR